MPEIAEIPEIEDAFSVLMKSLPPIRCPISCSFAEKQKKRREEAAAVTVQPGSFVVLD
jgi:hypothetical protein